MFEVEYFLRALSELLSVVILLVLVVGGTAAFTTISQQKIFSNTFSISEALDYSAEQNSELLEKIVMTKTQNTSTLYLINYGFKDIIIEELLIDDATKSESDFSIYSIDNIRSYGKTIPFLPSKSTVKLFINEAYAEKIILLTDSKNIFSFTK